MDKKVIAVVLARGGSKGVPGKNIKDIAGKPLIGWVIDAAKNSKYVDRVILSTDYDDIAAVGKECGAEVLFKRPAELAEDTTSDTPVFQHAMAWLKENEGYEPDIVVHLRPTGPLLESREIDAGIEMLLANPEADCVRSVEEPPKPPFKMWKPIEGSDRIEPFIGVPGLKDAHTAARQLLPMVYQTTADLGVFWLRTLLEKDSIIGDTVLAYKLDRDTVDIDTPMDFEIGKMMLEKRDAIQ